MEEQLMFLVESGFPVGEIASLFTCSHCTIECRLLKIGITSHRFTHIELD